MIPRLDTLETRLYKARPLLLAGLLIASGAWAEQVNGALVPDGSEKVGESRYRSRQDFEATLKFYKVVYPLASYPRKSIVNQPGIKAVHIVNPSGKNFEGLNIYQANDEVRIYVIPVGDVKPVNSGKKKGAEGKARREEKVQ